MQSWFRTRSAILILGLATSCLAADRPIDIAHSTLRIHVGKSGLFSAAAHEHWVIAPIAEGSIDDAESSRVWFRVEAGKLQVEPDTKLASADQLKVQETMQTKVLDSAHFPDIRFRSTSIQKKGDSSWAVTGNLTLHGQTRSVSAAVHLQANAYAGRCQIRQTDFGIKPVTIAGGIVKVKDELQIEFSITPASTTGP